LTAYTFAMINLIQWICCIGNSFLKYMLPRREMWNPKT
jgi:hypothetical protein